MRVIATTEDCFKDKDKWLYKHGIEKSGKRWNLEGDYVDELNWILQNKFYLFSYFRDLLNDVLSQSHFTEVKPSSV